LAFPVSSSLNEPLKIFAGTAEDGPPFTVDALVMEQDRDLLLDPDRTLKDPGESIKRLLKSIEDTKPQPPGTVVVRGRQTPYCFLAIVHDFAVEPSWKEAWVTTALDAIFSAAAARRLRSIGLPLLGTVYGRLERRRSVELLERSLARGRPEGLERLWLLVPSASDPTLLQPLREAGHVVTVAGESRDTTR
jgi:hypothetical protein